jgi:hypothetical protein
MDVERARREGRIRRYEVCGDHHADYFGRGRFLSMGQLERIRMDLVPAQVHNDTTRDTAPRPAITAGPPSAPDGQNRRGRSRFSAAEVAEIKQILREKQKAPGDRRKALSAKLRRQFRFYISEHSDHRPFVESDFDELIRRGTITVAGRG